MIFSQMGSRRSAPARSEDGEIPKGVEVVVTRYESGIAYVRPLGRTHQATNDKET